MKKMTVAVAAACAALAAGAAQAQTNVQLYGLIDLSIGTQTHVDAAGHSLTSMWTAPWFSGNRWGLRGSEDLGNGTNAIFKLESEYDTPTGAMDTPGVLFNRDAWVGLQGASWGKLTLGRQNTLARDFSQNYGDAYGTPGVVYEEGGWTNVNNFKQMIFYAASPSGTRYDNGVVYKYVGDSGFAGGLAYQFGGVPGNTSTNSTKAAALAYNGGMFNVSGFAQSFNVAGNKSTGYSVGGDAIFGIFRVNAGLFHFGIDQGANGALGKRTDNAWTLSTKITPTDKYDFELGYQQMKAKNAAGTAVSGTSFLALATPYANTTSGFTKVANGKKGTLYTSFFYHLTKRTETYIAADFLKLSDVGHFKGDNDPSFTSQTEYVVGIRTRF